MPSNQGALFVEPGRQLDPLEWGRKSASQKYWSKRLSASSRRDISRINLRFFGVALSMSPKYSISFDRTDRMLEPSPICLLVEVTRSNWCATVGRRPSNYFIVVCTRETHSIPDGERLNSR